MTYTVREGTLLRDGAPLRLLGANYFPALAGCRIWVDWDPDTIRRDFAAMARAELNAVRIFVIWRDFEPEQGQIDPVSLDRLAEVVSAARSNGLHCLISLFTIWMNGERLDLPWREARSLWRDPLMLERQEQLAGRIAARLHEHDNVVAFDLGDEIANVDPAEAGRLTRADVASWYTRLVAAVRAHSPNSLVLQANDASAVFDTTPFGVDNAAQLDLLGVHAFPLWSPGGIESTKSYKATNLAPFVARFAAAYGAPLIDEMGSYGVDEPTATAFLGASAAASIAAGAAGVFVWCWTDIVSEADPYRQRPTERAAGLVTADGNPKPRLRALRRISRTTPSLAVDRGPAQAAIFLNERLRHPVESYQDISGAGPRAVFVADLLLTRAHLGHIMLAESTPMPDGAGPGLVICPSVEHLTLRDLRRIRELAERGATVYLSSGSHLTGFPGDDLAGARVVDFCRGDPGKAGLRWGDQRWPLDWRDEVGTPSTLEATTGTVLAEYLDGTPALVDNPVGLGRILYTNLPLERFLDGVGGLDSACGEIFYRMLAEVARVRPKVDCPEPEVELIVGTVSGSRCVVVVNHADRPVQTVLATPSDAVPVALAAKDWTVVELGEATA
ncbi:cellulase family glycosylhydrolase [Micromonospora sp. CPCC 205539]|uniref:glycoside hydrolase 5 family protein n=1 Tax=Micromonospora sp. CPCC 205539 TaxID=3122408 RepID=UPI002FF22920